MNFNHNIKEYIELEIEILSKIDTNSINSAISLILKTYEQKARVFIFGNGGSAATASHFQNDFNKGLSEFLDRKFQFICLNDNVPTIMAIANDIGYEEIFRYQLRNNIEPNDIVIAISGSGNSKNIINAVEYAKSLGNQVIGITGFNGGKLKNICDVSVNVPVNSMQITEDIHMIFDHLMMSVLMKHMANMDHLANN